MNLNPLSFAGDKDESKEVLLDFIKAKKLHITEEDFNKPWGGYFRIDDKDLLLFIDEFFSNLSELKNSKEKSTQKFLLVAPNEVLSWQDQHKSAEFWKVLFGPVGVVLSETGEQTAPKWYQTGEFIQPETTITQGLIGADNWGVVAEITFLQTLKSTS